MGCCSDHAEAVDSEELLTAEHHLVEGLRLNPEADYSQLQSAIAGLPSSTEELNLRRMFVTLTTNAASVLELQLTTDVASVLKLITA